MENKFKGYSKSTLKEVKKALENRRDNSSTKIERLMDMIDRRQERLQESYSVSLNNRIYDLENKKHREMFELLDIVKELREVEDALKQYEIEDTLNIIATARLHECGDTMFIGLQKAITLGMNDMLKGGNLIYLTEYQIEKLREFKRVWTL